MKRHLTISLALAGAAAFCFSLFTLFNLRFSSGDVYPVGSSQRADPLGVRAFHDALTLQPGLRVERIVQPLERHRPPIASTLFLCGLDPEALFEADYPPGWSQIDSFLNRGGRVVLAINPLSAADHTNRFSRILSQSRLSPTNDSELPGTLWGFNIQTDVTSAQSAIRVTNVPDQHLPKTLPWHSIHGFNPVDPKWEIVYERNGIPVVLHRRVQQGTLVLVASSYLLSNQGLLKHPEPAFLSWLVGPHSTVLFDETHLGLQQEPGIASLMRRYRLEGAFFAIAIIAGVYIWRQSVLHPRSDAQPTENTPRAGRDSQAGLVHLLRRAVPPDQLTATCVDLWRQSLGHRPVLSSDRLADIQDIADREQARPSKERRPVDAHQAISERLKHCRIRPHAN